MKFRSAIGIIILAILIPAGAAQAQDSAPIISVDYKKMTLSFEKNGDTWQFPVALSRKNLKLPAEGIKGVVRTVIVGAAWYPTPATRAYYLKAKKKELPGAVPPGHPLNAMGAGKIIIDFEENKILSPPIRIHGTNDPSSIGQRVTRGCVRLKNEDFLKLAKLIGKEKAVVIFK